MPSMLLIQSQSSPYLTHQKHLSQSISTSPFSWKCSPGFPDFTSCYFSVSSDDPSSPQPLRLRGPQDSVLGTYFKSILISFVISSSLSLKYSFTLMTLPPACISPLNSRLVYPIDVPIWIYNEELTITTSKTEYLFFLNTHPQFFPLQSFLP